MSEDSKNLIEIDVDDILEDGLNTTFEFETQASKLVSETPLTVNEKYQDPFSPSSFTQNGMFEDVPSPKDGQTPITSKTTTPKSTTPNSTTPRSSTTSPITKTVSKSTSSPKSSTIMNKKEEEKDEPGWGWTVLEWTLTYVAPISFSYIMFKKFIKVY